MHALLFLDPGHFHAALTLRVPQARTADEVFVYAREGAELRDFLALVERFNRRSPHPTRWRLVVTTSDDPSGRKIAHLQFVGPCPMDLFEMAVNGCE